MNAGLGRETGFIEGLCEKRESTPRTHRPFEIFRLLLSIDVWVCSYSQLSITIVSTMFQSIRVALPARLPARLVRWNSTGPVLPPLMGTLRTDLKTAMRAKDTTR